MAEIFEIMTDPAHLVAEFFFEGAFLLLGLYIARRHDRKFHEHEHNSG